MNECVPQCIWCPCDAYVSAGPNPCAPHSQTAVVLLHSSCPEHSDTTQHLLYTHTQSIIRQIGIVHTLNNDNWLNQSSLWVVCILGDVETPEEPGDVLVWGLPWKTPSSDHCVIIHPLHLTAILNHTYSLNRNIIYIIISFTILMSSMNYINHYYKCSSSNFALKFHIKFLSKHTTWISDLHSIVIWLIW